MNPIKDELLGPPSLKIIEKYGIFFPVHISHAHKYGRQASNNERRSPKTGNRTNRTF
jgi:hypothetical protein